MSHYFFELHAYDGLINIHNLLLLSDLSNHSTVTDFAKFRGISTFFPLLIAI